VVVTVALPVPLKARKAGRQATKLQADGLEAQLPREWRD